SSCSPKRSLRSIDESSYERVLSNLCRRLPSRTCRRTRTGSSLVTIVLSKNLAVARLQLQTPQTQPSYQPFVRSPCFADRMFTELRPCVSVAPLRHRRDNRQCRGDSVFGCEYLSCSECTGPPDLAETHSSSKDKGLRHRVDPWR